MTMNSRDMEELASLDSPEVKEAIESLAIEVLKGTLKMYRMGSPSVRIQIAKSIMPLLVRQMKKDQESEEIVTLRKQMEWLQEQITDTSPTRLKVVNGEVITEDGPPKGKG